MKKKIAKSLEESSQMLGYFLMLQKAVVENLTGKNLPDFKFVDTEQVIEIESEEEIEIENQKEEIEESNVEDSIFI